MKEQIKKAKKELIELMCNEAARIIDNSVKKNAYCNCGWVDYIDNEMIQYEIVGAYTSLGGFVCLVHKTGSEGENRGQLRMMNQIQDIQKLEWILKGLEENNERIN